MSKGKGSFPKFCFTNNNGHWDSESTLALREGKGSLGTFSRSSAVLSEASGLTLCDTLVLVGYIIQEGPEVANNLFLVLLLCKYISDISVIYRHIHCKMLKILRNKHTTPFPPTLPSSAYYLLCLVS